MVSTATRLFGSWRSSSSRIVSLIASQILSGWPSVTDSEVNRRDVTKRLLRCGGLTRGLASDGEWNLGGIWGERVWGWLAGSSSDGDRTTPPGRRQTRGTGEFSHRHAPLPTHFNHFGGARLSTPQSDGAHPGRPSRAAIASQTAAAR